ncbi:MAG: FHA domain-containing protein [Thermoguttaceae bacterium]
MIPLGGGDDIPLKKKELIIGRKESCDIVLRFPNVSGRHCRLVLADGYWYLVDMGSSNGIKVGGAKVLDHRIDPNVKFEIANHPYLLEYDPKANGAVGSLPPDHLETDIFSKSLMERAGLTKSGTNPGTSGGTGRWDI